MALPELTVPSVLPVLLGSDHGIEQGDVYGHVELTRRNRVRRLRTAPHRIVNVKWDLTSDQMGAFYRWYEEDLQAGVRQFSVQVANQGPGLLWWRAEWEEPYKAEPSQVLDWFVTGRIRLLGQGSVDGPVDTGLRCEVAWAVFGNANAQLQHVFAIEHSWAFTPLSTTPLEMELSWRFLVANFRTGTGAAAGSSEALGVDNTPKGLAAGTSTASATGLSNRGTGAAAGTSTATAVGRSNRGTGSASGTSTATGIS